MRVVFVGGGGGAVRALTLRWGAGPGGSCGTSEMVMWLAHGAQPVR